MRIYTLYLLLASLISCVVMMPCQAQDEGRGFPGKGERAKWVQANKPFNEGILFYRALNYESAITKYKEAIQIYADDYEYYNSLGLAYKKTNRLEEALEAFKKSIELKDNSWESWSNLGSIYKRQNHPHEAFDAYSRALQFNPPQKSKVLILQNVAASKEKMTPAK